MRLFILCVLNAYILIAASGCSRAARQADLHPIPKQNVLLITIDTLRADALSAYGGQASTPALDRLAAEGARFDFAHAHAVLTLTSHASILTGTYPFQHGLRDNSGYRMPAGARTAATLLKSAGYATAAFVGAFPLHSRFGLNQGFDVYDDRFGETDAPTEFVMPERPATAVVALARRWIAEQSVPSPQAPVPWFVWVHVFDPHAPYKPPPPLDAEYAGRPYYGEVAATDAALAPLLEDVRAQPRPTLVVVTGDHGEALGAHGEQSHGVFAYESTLRVPLIIAEVGPAEAGPHESGGRDKNDVRGVRLEDVRGVRLQADLQGEVSSVSARHVDILPTILDATGQPVPADLPGRTLLAATERQSGGAPRASYFEAMSGMLNRGWAPLSGVIADREKYIELPIPERYDLATDPGEQNNVAGRSPGRDRALMAMLRAFQPSAPGQRIVEDTDAAARLRALGYVSGAAAAKAKYTDADDPKRLVAIDQEMHTAVAAFDAGRAADAVRLYQNVIAQRPDMALAYRHLAFLLWRSGNAPEAVAVLQRAVKAGVADPRALTELAGYLTDTGHVAEGARLLEPLAKAATAEPDVLNSLGIAYARLGRADQARRVFERVLTIDPSSSIPLENLGLLALDRGDAAGAKEDFDRAVALNPRSSRAQDGVGNVALRMGDRSGAVTAWRRAVELDPSNFDALYNLGVTLQRDGKSDAARPYLERFLRTAPRSFFAKELEQVGRLLQTR